MTQALSIRARLVIGMVVLVSIGLTVANVAGVLLLRSYLYERVDDQVAAISGPGAADPLPATPSTGQLCANPRDPRGLRSDFVLLILDGNGKEVCSVGPDLGEAGPDLAALPNETNAQLTTLSSLDGQDRWRVRIITIAENDRTLVLAVSLADADATVRRLTLVSVLISTIVLLGTGGAAWLIARIGLGPLRKIEDTAERIAAGDLTERVPAYRGRTEVGRLAAALNGMLGQIERAFSARTESETRLRRFISDASHELRTPLSTIRGHAELWRNGLMREGPDTETLVNRIEGEAKRMSTLVDDMLLLARLDQARPLEEQAVDMLSLATDAVVDAEARQPAREIVLDHRPGDQPPVITGDEARLRQVITNLISNALTHTPASSAVAVQISGDVHRVEVRVTDQGPGMPPEVVDKVFDRFYRADPGRGRSHGGSGLGLAIVDSLVRAHGGQVTCVSSPAGGTTCTVSLPRQRAARLRPR
jgi:two-component system OmpR family sensor kinase